MICPRRANPRRTKELSVMVLILAYTIYFNKEVYANVSPAQPVVCNVRSKLVNMQRVSSSAISAVGYDARTMRMKIKFKSGGAYDFCAVPEWVYVGLMTAPSKGRYYNTYIRDRYQCF